MRRLTDLLQRTLEQWRTGHRNLRDRASSEEGDTLVEVLLAITVLGIAGVALLAGFATSITASAQHRHLAQLDSSIRVAANRAIADVQQEVRQFSHQANDPFTCQTPFTPTFPSLTGSYQVTSTTGWWNGSYFQGPSPTYQGPNTCIAGAAQQYTLTITSTSPSVNIPPVTVTTVISDPAAPLSPTGAGATYQLVWLQQPGGGSAQTPLAPQPEVAVEDQQGDIVSSDFSSVTLSLLQAPSGGAISNTCSGVESYGIVQFTDCSVNKAGSYQVQAVDTGLQPTPAASFSVGSNPAVRLAFTSTAVSGTASKSATSGPITVQIEDSLGNPITSTTAQVVTLTSSSTGGIFSLASGGTAVTSVTIPAGQASASFYYGDSVAGTPTITATPPVASGLLAGQQQEAITGATGTQLAITSPAFTAGASSSATNAFTVTLEDTFGNPTTKATATTVNLSTTATTTGKFAAGSGGAKVTSVSLPANTQTVTAFYGDTQTGTPTITATATGLTPSGTQKETITGGPTKLVFTTSPVSGSTSAAASLGPITVQEQAANGTPTTVGLTINLSSNSAGTPIFGTTQGATTGVTSVTIPGGSSSATFYYGDTNVGTPTITASVSGTALSVTQQETVTAGAGTQLAITSTAFSSKASLSATNAFTVTLEDSFGNTTKSASPTTVNLLSNSAGTYEFAASSGGATVTSVTLPANTSSVTAFYGDTRAGTPTITAAATGLLWGTQQETITAGSGTQLAITSAPFNGTANSSATNAFTVTLEDGFGNATTKATVTTINLTSNTTGIHEFAAASGGTNVTSVSLPANTSSVTAFYGDVTPGTPTITAAATGLTPSGTQQETISAGAPTKLVVITSAVSGPASNSATLGPITVQEQDAYGNVTSGGSPTTVNLTSSSTGATFAATSGGSAVTSVVIPGGNSTATFFYGDTKAGHPTVTASAAGLTSGTQQETITALAGTQLGVSTFTGGAGTSATNSFTVTLQDSFGNTTTKTTATTVNLSTTSTAGIFAASSGGATVTSVSLPANTSSVTAFYGDTKAGTPTITAAATGLNSGSQAETITGGTATHLAITSSAFTSGANTLATNALTVTLQDAFNNATTKTTATTVNLSSTDAGTGTFAASSGGATVTSVSLPANTTTVTAFFGDTKVGTPTITAAATGLTPSPTQQETITAGAAAQLIFTTTTKSGAASTSATLGPITVQEQDAFGNVTTAAVTVNLSSSSGAGKFAATSGGASVSSINIAAGNSTATFFYGDTKAGTPIITAGATGLTAGTQAETITALSGTQLAITSTAFSGTASNSATNSFTVTLEDTFGNATTKTTATTVNLSTTATGTGKFAATSGGATVTSVTLPANTQSVTAFYGDTLAGTPTITAAATGLTPSGTQQETITGGTGTHLAITSTAFSGGASNSATNAFTVTLEDAFNNVTTKTTATTVNLSTTATGTGKFAATSGGATVTSVTLPANTASVTAYYGDTKAGTPTITAAATGLTPSATQAETITGGTGTQLAITSTAFSGGASSSATNAFTVTLEDTFGNAATSGAATTVNLSTTATSTGIFAATSGGATVTSVTLPANTSSVTAYYGDTKSGAPTVTAAATGLNSGSQQETITGGTATQLAITSNAFSGVASSSATNSFTVTLEDAFGNAATKATATTVNLSTTATGTGKFAASSGGATVTSVTLPATTSSITAFYGDTKVGTPTITAAATGLTPSATQQETITGGTATHLAITSTAFSGVASSSATNAFTVTLQDAFNNTTTKTTTTTVNLSTTDTGTGIFAANSGGATVTSVTLPANTSSVTAFYGDTNDGTPTITAAATGLIPSATQQETITAGTASQVAITSTAFTGGAGTSATNSFTVTLQDSFGNTTTKTTATTVNLSTTSTAGIFAASSGGATVTSVSLPANTSSVTAFYGDTKAGTPTITAAATGLNSGSQAETITGGTATHLAITSSAFTSGANTLATNALTVTLQDAFNNATTKTTATTVNLSSTDAGTGTFAASSGGATVTSVSLPANTTTVTAFFGDTKVGTPTITAAATGLTPSPTQQETITAGAAAQLIFTTTTKSGAASTSATLGPITVQEQDAFGNVTTAAVTVNLSSSSGAGKFAATSGGASVSSINIAAGNSTATFFYGDTKAGTPIITAGATGLTAGTQAETITALSGTQLAITSTAFSGTASNSATNSFTVTLEDTFGNATTKTTATTVNLSTTATGTGKFAATSGGATVTSVTLPANTQSVTAFYGDTLAGTPTITAAATGLTPSGTQQETITGGTGTHLAITSTAFSGGASNSATNAFTVTLEDAFNNVTTKTTATTVNLSTTATGTGKFAATSGGATVTSVTLPANTASVTAYYGDTLAGTPTITAAATGLTPSATQAETINAGAAAQLNFISAAVAGVASANANLGPITVQLQDQFDNPVNAPAGGEQVTLISTTPNNASFSQTQNATGSTTATITIASGSSTASFYYGYLATGTPTINASHTGLTPGSQQETIGPNQLVITSAPVSGGTSTNATLGPITVTLETVGGATVTAATNTPVTLTSSSNKGVFAATSGGTQIGTVTILAGNSTATFFYGDNRRGTPTITTAGTNLTSGTQQENIT